MECSQLRCAEAEKNHETSRFSGATSGKQKAKKAEAKGKDGAVPDRYPHPAKPPVSNDLSEKDAGNLLNKRLLHPDVSVRSQMPRPDIRARRKSQRQGQDMWDLAGQKPSDHSIYRW